MIRAQSVLARVMTYGNALIVLCLAIYFLFIPGLLVMRNLGDPELRTGDIPREAWRLHRYLAPRYERWARARIASQRAADVHYLNVSGTEWPLFGSVFYLWGTEHLQEAWEEDRSRSAEAPSEYARGAIEACKDLILDPTHHSWVKRHWGDDYMHDQNVFFRSLVIAGLTSYEKLVGSGEYLPLLRDQIDTLAKELDGSPYGVLYDYPGECYPIDVFAAVAWIRRADAVAGADHSAFVARERRAFQGNRLDRNGLIPWLVNPETGEQYQASRGIVNSHILVFAPQLYPDLARVWYERYEAHFWQETWWAAGFREFYRDRPGGNWTYDIDAGPIVGGFSPSANAFGVAAARRNGRLDHAYTLGTQLLTACWPLPDGRLLGPQILSDCEHAPYLGETAILWQLTETPPEGISIVRGGNLPGSVYIGLAFYFGGSLLVFLLIVLRLRRFHHSRGLGRFLGMRVQLPLWVGLLVAAPLLLSRDSIALGAVALLVAQVMPVLRTRGTCTESD